MHTAQDVGRYPAIEFQLLHTHKTGISSSESDVDGRVEEAHAYAYAYVAIAIAGYGRGVMIRGTKVTDKRRGV
jgi:hypothetical protein